MLNYNSDDDLNGYNEHNLANLNLTVIENEFKRHSVKDIIYLKLNKSLFVSKRSTNTSGMESNAFIEVSIERLQQNSKNLHVLSMNLKNLKVEPLFEINHVKAKLTYFKINLVDSEDISNETNNEMSMISNNKNKSKNYAKIHRIKRIKCKFNANNT